MTRDDIKPGFMLHFTNGSTYTVISVEGILYLMLISSSCTSYKLNEFINEDLKSTKLKPSIKTITNDIGKLVWTKPVEMTISEIEHALDITPGSLIIKD